MTDSAWILESPDGGKTVSKRKFGEQDKFYLSNINNKWYNYQESLEAIRQRDHEADLRAQHPALQDAYNVYLALLGMVEPETVDTTDKQA